MKFTVSSLALLKHLHTLQGVASGSKTVPILDYFLFRVENGQLTVTASDLETTVTTTMPVEGKADGMLAIPARRLVKVLKVLPSQHLTLEADKGFRARIQCDQGNYVITGADPGQYPAPQVMEGAATFTIPASNLRKGIAKTLWAVGHDDLRPVMAGVFFELSEDATRFVATDAHRLVVHSCNSIRHSTAGSFIVPTKAAGVLLKYMALTSGDVTVSFNESKAAFAFDNVVVSCRVIDGKYPKYDAVIPKDPEHKLTVERIPFIGSVRRMEVFSNRITHQIRFVMSTGSVVMSAEDLDDESTATERLACGYEGEPLKIGFNSHFLLDVLKNLSGAQVVLQMGKPNQAVTIAETNDQGEESTLSLVMPVLLND